MISVNSKKTLMLMMVVFSLFFSKHAFCENIYISDSSSIYEDLLLKQPGMLWPPKTGLYTPNDEIGNIFIDINNNMVYWHGWNDRKIYRANIDGSQIEMLFDAGAAGYSTIHDIAVDMQAAKIYWASRHIARAEGEILRMNLDGSGLETVFSGQYSPTGLDLDTINNKIYWTSYHAINRANIDGSGFEELLYLSNMSFDELIVDPLSELIYWNDANDGDMYKTSLDGSSTYRFYNGAYDIYDFDIHKDKIYITHDYLSGDAMSYMNTDGSNFRVYLMSGAGHYPGIDVTPSQATIEGTYPKFYTTLQDSYDNAANGAVIKSLAMDFNEDLSIDQSKSVTFEGGYDHDYSSNNDVTRLIGNILISNGTLIIENFELE